MKKNFGNISGDKKHPTTTSKHKNKNHVKNRSK